MSYIQAAIEMRSVKDAEADYNASLSMGADQFPLEMLAPEERANTGTDTKTNQGSWLDRLFEQAAAAVYRCHVQQRRVRALQVLPCDNGWRKCESTGQV